MLDSNDSLGDPGRRVRAPGRFRAGACGVAVLVGHLAGCAKLPGDCAATRSCSPPRGADAGRDGSVDAGGGSSVSREGGGNGGAAPREAGAGGGAGRGTSDARPDSPDHPPDGGDGGSCAPGHAHCSGASTSPCETDLTASEDHCGACNHGCLGGGCDAGRCQPILLADGQADADVLRFDGERLFWVAPGDGAIRSVSRDGGPIRTYVSGQSGASDVATDGTYVYWSLTGDWFGGSAPGSIRRLPLAAGDGGAPETFYQGAATSSVVEILGNITADATNLYFHVWNHKDNQSAFLKQALAGGAAAPVYPATGFAPYTSALAMITDGSDLFVSGGPGDAASGGWVFRIGIANGSFQKLWQSAVDVPIGVELYANRVYFSAITPTDGSSYIPDVQSVARTGGPAASLGAGAGFDIKVDATGIYTAGETDVQRMPLAGGKVVALATGHTPRGLAVDATAVYWVDTGPSGAIWKVAK